MQKLSDPACLRTVLDRMSGLHADLPRRWGRMNAHQMVCHLADSFSAAMGRRPVSPATKQFGRAMKWAALYLPTRWPHGVPTPPELDQEKVGTSPGDFEMDLREAMALTREFARQSPSFSFAPHPIFNRLTEQEWMRWGYLHVDHHLRQFGV